MKIMTYQELLEYLQSLTDEQKKMDVYIYNQKSVEVNGVTGVFVNELNDVLEFNFQE